MLKSSMRSPPVPQTSTSGPCSLAGSIPGSTARVSSACTKPAISCAVSPLARKRLQEFRLVCLILPRIEQRAHRLLDLLRREILAVLQVVQEFAHREAGRAIAHASVPGNLPEFVPGLGKSGLSPFGERLVFTASCDSFSPLFSSGALPPLAASKSAREQQFRDAARLGAHPGGQRGRSRGRAEAELDRVEFSSKAAKAVAPAGLTNEEHHTGNQALFVQFDHVAQSYQAVMFTSNFIPVASGTDYEVGIWGQIDPKESRSPAKAARLI